MGEREEKGGGVGRGGEEKTEERRKARAPFEELWADCNVTFFLTCRPTDEDKELVHSVCEKGKKKKEKKSALFRQYTTYFVVGDDSSCCPNYYFSVDTPPPPQKKKKKSKNNIYIYI